MTEIPATMNYTSVLSCETDCWALVITELDDLDVKCGDVVNAYITTPIEEKVLTTLGPEFGDDAGKWALLFRALYSLNSYGADFFST